MAITHKSLEIEADPGGGLMAVTVSGKLDKEDYEYLNTEFDQMLSAHERIRLLIELKDFHGWTAGAAWEDAKMGMHHYSDIERMAVIGENKWEQGMTLFVKPFTRAKVRYFDAREADAANAWIVEKV